MLPVSEIIQYSRNPRIHSHAQIAEIAASIDEFGFTNPILVDADNVLIAGHGRLSAARKLGLTEVPAIILEGLSDAQKQALRIADNKIALNAGWDDDLLRTELMDLRDSGFDLALTGFGENELADIFADRTAGLTDPDEVPHSAGRASDAGRRCVAAGAASAGVRGCHQRGGRVAGAGRREAALDGH